jgi:protein TonB
MHIKSVLKSVLFSSIVLLGSAVARAENAFDEAPTPVQTRAPAYPEPLRREGVSGMVSINVTIDEGGNVTKAVVAKSSNVGFEQAAIEAVSHWKFKPAKKSGQAVAVSVVLPVRFTAQ